MPLAVPLSCAFVIGLLTRLRYRGEALRHASPVPAPPWAWDVALALLAIGALAAAWRDRRALARPGARRAIAELGIYPLGLALVWGALPAYPENYGPWHYGLIAAFSVLVGLLFWRDRANRTRWGLTTRRLAPALRALAVPTGVLLVAGLALTAATAGFSVRWGRLALGVATYPLYAVAQLLVLHVFLIRRLELLTDSRPLIVSSAALVFALVHWPNGIVAFGCLLGAAVWARDFLRHDNLLAVALSMGVLAGILGSVVARPAIRNARSGPIYVQREIDEARLRAYLKFLQENRPTRAGAATK
jgi:hypothetical protein